MANIEDTKLIDLIPSSLKDDPNVLAAVEAIDKELNEVSKLCNVPALKSRTDELSSKTLDHMAWQVDSKTWKDTWPLSIKRSMIKAVTLEKVKKGTLSSVSSVLNGLGSNFALKEWWENSPKTIPHTFNITVLAQDIEGQLSSDTINDIIANIDNSKPVRSHYRLTIATQSNGGIGTIAAIRPFSYAKLSFNEAQ